MPSRLVVLAAASALVVTAWVAPSQARTPAEPTLGPLESGTSAYVHGTWRAVPQYHGMFVCTYREDLFKKAGLKTPDTWEDLYVVGKELKKMGNPIGIPISQNYDSISTAGPVLWSFGGLEIDKDGKKLLEMEMTEVKYVDSVGDDVFEKPKE